MKFLRCESVKLAVHRVPDESSICKLNGTAALARVAEVVTIMTWLGNAVSQISESPVVRLLKSSLKRQVTLIHRSFRVQFSG
jgi:hypothetical protein